jgi:glycosyltransferase involved in cell wall biosynthesis
MSLRVLTFLHSFEPGGVERIALRLVRAWQGTGVDAPLFMGREDGAMREELAFGLDYHVPRQLPFSVAWFETLWMIVTLPRTIRRLRPDILFCAGNSYAVVAVAMKMLLRSACPPIVAKMSNDLERRDMPWPVRACYHVWLRVQGRVFSHFVGMEQPMAQEIEHAVRPRGGITIIPDPAVSLEQIAHLRKAADTGGERLPGGLRFVAVGRLVPQKNIALMLEAFARGSRPDDTLTLFGDGQERKQLQALAQSLGIDSRVSFEGHVADPASRLGGYDIFLLSSDYEGVPAVVIEALAAGLPIIATDCSRSMSALLGHGTLGSLLPVGCISALARAIADAGKLRQDSSASLDQARRFALESASLAYLACFQTVAQGRRIRNKFARPTAA